MLKPGTAVLISVLFGAGCATADRATAIPPQTNARMDDATRYGNRFHLPFTRDEVLRAESLLGSREHARLIVRAIYDEPDAETMGVTIMPLSLLLLATLSEDVARRVVEYRPALREEVEQVRADPDGWLARLRAANPEGNPGSW